MIEKEEILRNGEFIFTFTLRMAGIGCERLPGRVRLVTNQWTTTTALLGKKKEKKEESVEDDELHKETKRRIER